MSFFNTSIVAKYDNDSDDIIVSVVNRILTFQSIEDVEKYQPSIKVTYTVIMEDGTEISVSDN